jgi:hypothetical protein
MGGFGVDAESVSPPACRGRRWLGGAAGTFAVVLFFYVLTAVLVRGVFGSEADPAFFAPSAGVTVAAAVLSRRSLWPVIGAAIVLGELTVGLILGNSPAVSANVRRGVADSPVVRRHPGFANPEASGVVRRRRLPDRTGSGRADRGRDHSPDRPE